MVFRASVASAFCGILNTTQGNSFIQDTILRRFRYKYQIMPRLCAYITVINYNLKRDEQKAKMSLLAILALHLNIKLPCRVSRVFRSHPSFPVTARPSLRPSCRVWSGWRKFPRANSSRYCCPEGAPWSGPPGPPPQPGTETHKDLKKYIYV